MTMVLVMATLSGPGKDDDPVAQSSAFSERRKLETESVPMDVEMHFKGNPTTQYKP